MPHTYIPYKVRAMPMFHVNFQLPMRVIDSNTLDNGQSCFTGDIHASLKITWTLWKSDKIGRLLISDLPKMVNSWLSFCFELIVYFKCG